MLRKTAYLLAVWGEGDFEEIKKAARHESSTHAMTYKSDAMYLLQVAKANNFPYENTTPKWKQIRIENIQLGRRLNAVGNRFQSLSTLADTFIMDLGRINSLHETSVVKKSVMASLNCSRPLSRTKDLKALLADLDPEVQRQVMEIIDAEVVARSGRLAIPSEAQPIDLPPVASIPPAQVVVSSPTAQITSQVNVVGSDQADQVQVVKSVKRGGMNDLESRAEIRNLKGMAKLNFILNMDIPDDHKELTEAARNFVVSVLQPMRLCLTDHCQGNKSIMWEKVKNDKNDFSHSKFAKNHCAKKCA